MLTTTEQRVWTEWNNLPDDCPSPIGLIARRLGMRRADVAFIVYPAETFGAWHDGDEPELVP